MKKPKHLTCRCGARKRGWDLMCRPCWDKVPRDLRRALARPDATLEDRRVAVRAINEFWARARVKDAEPRQDPRCPGDW